MQSITLWNSNQTKSVDIQWDQKTGQINCSDAELLRGLNKVMLIAIKQGYCDTPTIGFNVKIDKPLQDAAQLAVLLAWLDYYAPELPLPEPEHQDSDVELIY